MRFQGNLHRVVIVLVICIFVGSSGNECYIQMMNEAIRKCSGARANRSVGDSGKLTVEISDIDAGLRSEGRSRLIHQLEKRHTQDSAAESSYPIPELSIGHPPPELTNIRRLIDQEAMDTKLAHVLSMDEVKELYDELSQRHPRELPNSKDFFKMANECCLDFDACKDSPNIIKCV